ncbi:Scopoletin glucosyltransferase [Senna tora]|uniref:Scopoletin glucosyltransferase n=1 Tax=Senna tora TaxID=362788 RepID=A0A834SWR0_9FABA|nr:Scopoletin glucosyltransferase [Senna tora]
MACENQKLHVFFLPFLAQGHMLPTVDLARLFAARGVKATIVTTPHNLPIISRTIGQPKTTSHNIIINTLTIKFPSLEAGLPEGCENADTITSPSLYPNFFRAIQLLQEPLEQLLLHHHPDCLIANMFFPWATDSAAKFGIPRIVFNGIGSFALSALEHMRLHKPYKNVSSDSEPFVIPSLPGEIKITRMEIPESFRDDNGQWAKISEAMCEAELKSFGVIVNSFYELEQVYADHYKNVLGRKTWHVGPVSLSNRDMKEKANRGKEASIDEQECLKWLDSKQPDSVLYISFGSMTNFPKPQLKEIAMGLEASGQNFIWVVRSQKEEEEKEWLPEGFEKRMEEKGLIIRGWAPQLLILDHEAVGGFVTHCGWNSTLEGISAGVPMVTWPMGADQFYNQKFVTQVLGIGVAVGVKKSGSSEGESVEKEAIENAVNKIMEGEEAIEMRNRAKKFGKMAKEAVKEGELKNPNSSMASGNQKLHIFLFPFLAQGHMLPMVDLARLFTARGVKTTIITTPMNLPIISRTIGHPKTAPANSDNIIQTLTIKFPSLEAGLPEGCENSDSLPSPSFYPNFFRAIQMLQEPLEQLLLQHHPDCLVVNMFYTWATDCAAKFGVPTIVFQGSNSFALCAMEHMRLHKPYKNVLSDSEPFVIPDLPGEIKMTKMELPSFVDDEHWEKMSTAMSEAELKSFGVIVNSFYEMEQVYADHYKNVLGRKAWSIGPVSLSNRDIKEKANRGKEASIDGEECLKWLDSKNRGSVLYVCFGSMANFPKSQLREIAMGLEASGQNFIWVVRGKQEEEKEWLPEGFEERLEGKGLIIRGWAPQVLILDHEAVGGFVTHCGWNSTLEGISGGVAMVTWPLSAEQFYNQKFVTEILRSGVSVGVTKWVNMEAERDDVKKERIEEAVRKIMEGEEMKKRAREIEKMAKEAVKEGGSSYNNLTSLIQELEIRQHH